MAFISAITTPVLNKNSSTSFTGSHHLRSVQRHYLCQYARKAAFCRPSVPRRANFSSPRMDSAGAGIYDSTTGPSNVRAIIFGATGYIGRYVTFEFIRRGYDVIAFSRSRSGVGGKNDEEKVREDLAGAQVMFGDVTNADDVRKAFTESSRKSGSDGEVKSTIVVSCLASRTGGIADSNRIDYEATLNTLREGRAHGNVSHFILLSAICVQKPELEFQRTKLRFEAELRREASLDGSFSYSIVRPTAFFKSLAGQVERLKSGSAFIMFGDGNMCKCNALSERDLASFIADCAVDEGKRNQILPVGGPGEPQTPKEQAEMLFNILGKKPKYISLPIGIMDFSISLLDSIAKVLPFPQVQDAAEFGKIGRYYAVEDMVGPSYGDDTLQQFFEQAVKDGGMEGQDLGDAAIL